MIIGSLISDHSTTATIFIKFHYRITHNERIVGVMEIRDCVDDSLCVSDG